MQEITGKMEQVQVGNKTIQTENLNILHLAVYYENFEVVKMICELVSNMNLAYVGKIPSSTGLANDSEISITDYDSQRLKPRGQSVSHKYQMNTWNENTPRQSLSNLKVRSLILFWALDK